LGNALVALTATKGGISLMKRLVLLVAALVFATTAGTPAYADSTSVTIAKHALYIAPFQINVEVSVHCTNGFFAGVQVQVTQPHAGDGVTVGNGFTNALCDGQSKVVVPVFNNFGPPWTLGDAAAIGLLFTNTGPASDTRDIDIVFQ
jgi:hypothetical protein